ncbi:MAG: hypothetical protein ACI9OJ_001468 [Myxococcota bacterium]|jgi:hypothetical protein
MDPTLAAFVTTVAVFTSASIVARTRRAANRSAERHRFMAVERGLGSPEVSQLEHLTRMLPETTLADLMISPIRFDRAVAQYVRKLRSASSGSARYFGLIAELTRLRRKVHPPGSTLRFLHSSRELPDGEQTRGYIKSSSEQFAATVWSVNEDHFELRPDDPELVDRIGPDERIQLELTRPGQGRFRLEARVRMTSTDPSPRIRLEHTEDIVLANRREFVRERRTTPIYVTPIGESDPVEAGLVDIGGGGLAFVSKRSLINSSGTATRAEIYLALDDNASPPLKLPAVMLRAVEDENGKFQHSCRWDGVNDETRELIIRFVFGLQRRRIRAAKVLSDPLN